MCFGPLLFLIFFAFMSATVREKTANVIGTITHWINLYQPMSYLVVIVVILAPLLSFFLVAYWPRTQEPENPLLRYKNEHLDMD